MKLFIDFGGFYESIHTELVDQMIDMQGYNDFDGELNWDHIDYKATYVEYAKSYVDMLNKFFHLELKYVGLDSPRYYNYTTDKIIVEATSSDIMKLGMEGLTSDEFQVYVDEYFTPRDGWAPFYAGFDDIVERSKTDSDDEINLYGMVIDWLIQHNDLNNEEVFELEFDIIENKE